MIVFPNAKINIGLQVLEKRQDGFHNINSIFFPVYGLYDILEIHPSLAETEIVVTGRKPDGPVETNILIRAWKRLNTEYNIPPLKFFLHKIIPDKAGLGGASSDAAFAIKALNKCFDLGMTKEQEFSIAMELGSDCGFFIHNRGSKVSGRGEVISNIDIDLSGNFIMIIKPPEGISTHDAFKNLKISNRGNEINFIPEKNLWREYFYNDFEELFFNRYPQYKKIKETLYGKGAFFSSLSGTGSSIYGLFKHKPQKINFAGCFCWTGKL